MGSNDLRKWYPVTPSRKRLVKAVARRSFSSIANNTWSNVKVRPYLMNLFHRELRKEIKTLQSTSLLLQSEPKHLVSFKWKSFDEELKLKAPMFHSLLFQLTYTRLSRHNQSAVMCTCAAIILKHRYQKMSLIHKMISCVLYHGHCSKEVVILELTYIVTVF